MVASRKLDGGVRINVVNPPVMTPDGGVCTFALYIDPADYPGQYVVRRWVVPRGSVEGIPDREPLYVGLSRTEAAASVPQGLTWLPRLPQDDPAICGVWL